MKAIPFKLLVGNFRRKMIISTLKNNDLNYDTKKQLLAPLKEYLTQ